MKRYILVFLIIALFLVSGQAGCEKTQEVSTSEIVSIEFVEERPPEEVLDKNVDPFYIALKLKNYGDFTIPENKIYASITSLSKDAFRLSNLHATFNSNLFSKVDEIISEEEFELSRASYQYDLTKDFTTNIDVNVCYPYQTKSIFNVCLKKEAISREITEESCEVDSDLTVENQMAPLQITNVKQKAIGKNKIRLTFTINNIGNGRVYSPSAFSGKCLDNREQEDIIKVMIFSKTVPIQCSTLEQGDRGTTRLIGDSKIISCDINTANVPQISAFEEQFEVKLEYYNKYKVSKQIKVIDSSE